MAHDPKWYLDYNGVPPADDDGDYVWDRALKRWVPFHYDDEDDVDEDAVERAEERRRKRIEWDAYHPGEPCPECELE